MRFAGAFLLLLPYAHAANLPTFTYSSSGINQPNAIATDPAGNTYITGRASSNTPLVTTPGAFQPQSNAGTCILIAGFVISVSFPTCDTSFVVKLDPTGAVVFTTYLGGNGSTDASLITADQQGSVYIAGRTGSNDSNDPNTFPVTPGAAFKSGSAFITKLDSGGQLVYSTFIPAASNVGALAVDQQGNAYIAGFTQGVNFPTTPGAFQPKPPPGSLFPAFVAKLNASGSALSYATYLCGSEGPSGADGIQSIAVDAEGNTFVTGVSTSTDFPVTPGAFLTINPSSESVFLTKLNPQGTGLIFSTYLGPGTGNSVSLDAQGTAFVAGSAAPPFPATPGAVATGTGFLTHFSADGSSLISSTMLPVPVTAMELDSAGNATIASTVYSPGLPAGVAAFQPQYSGASDDPDVYVAKFSTSGQLQSASYLGGSQGALLLGFGLRPDGSVVVSGLTDSPDFPGLPQPYSGMATSFVTSIFPSLTVLNAGSFAPASIAPGEIVALRGYGIGPATGVSATGPALPNQLAGVTVSFGALPAPLFYAQSNQINVQVPWELAGQTSTTLQVSYPGLPSATIPVTLAPAQPGIFFVNNSDGTRNSPSNPAHPGDFIAIYGTGGGSMNPPAATGQFWSLSAPLSNLALPASVVVGGQNALVLYSGSAPTLESGFFQINAQLPSSLTATSPSLYITIGTAPSPAIPISIGTR